MTKLRRSQFPFLIVQYGPQIQVALRLLRATSTSYSLFLIVLMALDWEGSMEEEEVGRVKLSTIEA